MTEITKTPERVVAVGLTEQDTLLALGVTPVDPLTDTQATPGHRTGKQHLDNRR